MPWEIQKVETPRFQDSWHMKVVGLSALSTGHLYLPGNISGTHFCYRLSWPPGHSVAGMIVAMKNFNDTIGNRTREPPVYRAVLQPITPPFAPRLYIFSVKYYYSSVAQWLRCCARNRKVADSIPVDVSGIFIDIKSFRSHYASTFDSASNKNEYQEYFLRAKAAGA